jgi:hypothetical protein
VAEAGCFRITLSLLGQPSAGRARRSTLTIYAFTIYAMKAQAGSLRQALLLKR